MSTLRKTIGNIEFTSIDNTGSWKVPRNNLTSPTHLKSGANEFSRTGDPITILNAIEIDWNGAVLENADIENANSKTINTTSDLLELINEMQKEIYVIGAAVIASAGQ